MSKLPILLLCAFVLSCKSTKTATSSNESERNTAVQAQWRSAQNLLFSGLQRLTALSFDSCVYTFGGPDESAAPQCSAAISPSGKPQKSTKAKPSSSKASPSKVSIYGLHLSHAVEEKSSVYQREADSLAKAMQSSYDKSQNTQKKSKHFLSFPIKLTLLIFIIGIILLVLRHFHARRKEKG